MISISINACFQILLIISLLITLLYTFYWIEVNKILLTLFKHSILHVNVWFGPLYIINGVLVNLMLYDTLSRTTFVF